ncbi:CAF17-like 4Fe-4S cluster assembly/insertion protein YgfZ [Ramlibacter sp. PS4R-6]|uniref:CAF17-like 4Fe-4S cluster assembly/insertion protein YgfZ n=1 Tax=Ramlibacter sp. PS4R-6 TaxID=3133438 RepID=UPI0030A6A429
MTQALDGVAPLAHLGVIAVSGEDAVSFLQNQLTNDVALLGSGEARLAAYCSAKGRMQASFVCFKPSDTEVLLVMSRDILPQTLKRLSMFVLRAKAKLRDASGEYELWGVAGGQAPRRPWESKRDGATTLVGLYPADGTPRALAIGARPPGPELDPALWAWGEVRAGVATITAPIVEAFVPQMLNYESVGGVNFKKGCYPGQEIVARSQFRGTLKRRAFLAHGPAQLSVGQELFHESDASQPCGTVAQAAAAPGGACDAIVSIQLAAAQGGKVLAGGAELKLSPPPYPLLDDI